MPQIDDVLAEARRVGAEQLLAALQRSPAAPPSTAARIIAAACDVSIVMMSEMMGQSRRGRFSRPRQVAMWLVRQRTNLSLPQIGAAFGGRDHTTAMHAITAVGRRLEDRCEDTAALVRAVEGRLSQR